MRIPWTRAAADLERISNYLKEHHRRYQHATARKLYDCLTSLSGFYGVLCFIWKFLRVLDNLVAFASYAVYAQRRSWRR